MENCYFLVENVGLAEQHMKTLCEECQNKEKFSKSKCWFWEGSKLGYGPFDFICCECDHVIHSAKKEKE